jgi:hypothetical protein
MIKTENKIAEILKMNNYKYENEYGIMHVNMKDHKVQNKLVLSGARQDNLKHKSVKCYHDT